MPRYQTHTHARASSSTIAQKKSPVGMLQTTAARIEEVVEQQQQNKKKEKAAGSRWAEPSESRKKIPLEKLWEPDWE